MFCFIQPWSGQSGSGFFPHSPSPLALAVAPPPPALPASAVAAFSAGAADALADAGAAADPDADADAGASAVAAGALDAIGGTSAVAEARGVTSVVADFVHATISAASERTTGRERMGGELTRKTG